MSRVDVRVVDDAAAARAVAELFVRVWDAPPENPPMRAEVLRALATSGGYVTAAWLDGRVVGGSAGWLGREDGTLTLHSHLTGTEPGRQGTGVGLALKRHQRSWALANGIATVRWTYDPLVRRNAWFNIQKLGVRVEAYAVDFYGPLADGINEGDESDRLLAVWDVAGPRAAAAAADRLDPPDAHALRTAGAIVVLDIDDHGAPVEGESVAAAGASRTALCATPPDIENLRRAHPDRARAWR
ncbi:MAG: GNAT family N-acetyltransferase, partial [Acidimicrobiia bacterium]|nr:GNAT family N-acetyltransferase [Acidimicrobiia bacterium]